MAFNPSGKTFKQKLVAFLADAKSTYSITVGQDSGRTVAWQTKHHVAHMFLYNKYNSTKPRKSHATKRTISWTHFSDPSVKWKTIKQSDFLRTANNGVPKKEGKGWKAGHAPDEAKTIKHVKSIQKKGKIGSNGKAMVSAGSNPCGEPCRCKAKRSKHLAGVAADLKMPALNKLTAALKKANKGSLDTYLGTFGLHRPFLNHTKSPEAWHIESQ
jgi:hypothetical protein